jgi:N-formylglutamate deformylase
MDAVLIIHMKKLPILVVCSHSSYYVPKAIRANMLLTDRQIKNEADLYTDQIFKVKNAYYVEGKVSRLVADYNRAPDHIELEYQLARDGVVVSVNEDSKQVYKEAPTLEKILKRIEKYHDPFHNSINEHKDKVKFLIDGHSLRNIGPETKIDRGQERKDIVIGNRHFTTCPRTITIKAMDFFKNKGFSVALNDPYEGKYILGHHCSRNSLYGLQIEFNRKLYMNENTLRSHSAKISSLNETMSEFVEFINDIL